ncbi:MULTISPECIES: hypothetical protein [Streptomyces]
MARTQQGHGAEWSPVAGRALVAQRLRDTRPVGRTGAAGAGTQ